ncbi:uncharacterized methyltransferase At1g78140, chloroplastic [Argentina anserina]|uniref:uncharacterized methyltransferase At1g78140, chloroplastic n=1 Tax=Argentina anserina TaxID=57926 RepID=UPI00217688B3|nr:uncharacterized methyltransferase At1g78140, chloroplastic [Potentilla anserina]
MALATTTLISNLSLPSQLGNSRPDSFKLNNPFTVNLKRFSLFPAVTVRASSTAFVETIPSDPIEVQNEASVCNDLLACPICFEPFASNGESGSAASLECSTCKKTYLANETHLDLTVASGAKNYGESMPASTEIFRTPLVSFLYERGWRQSFSVWGGFPGPEKEFELVKDYLKPVLGGSIIDASCGSGLFSRLFAKSGLFSHVVALDYSENMLKQCYDFIEEEENFPKENITLVRADISRLPFATSSIDAVHAGAAIHCWPSPTGAVAEISRVLRPGGVFVATTYILDGAFAFVPFLREGTKRTRQVSGSQIFLSEGQLEDICTACGLVGFTVVRNRLFVMISATKPS